MNVRGLEASIQRSGSARFLGMLQDLERGDPARARRVLARVAVELRAEVLCVGAERAALLTALADRLEASSDAVCLSDWPRRTQRTAAWATARLAARRRRRPTG
jgi:hypothetical protein